MLISAKKDGITNTMTASWGMAGHLWNEDVVMVFIRPQRYTHEFVDNSTTFSISFFDGKKKELGYLGKVSGKDEDKISTVNFHVTEIEGTPTFEEAKFTIICEKIYIDSLKEDSFLNKEILTKHYPDMDLHTIYIGKVKGMYINE